MSTHYESVQLDTLYPDAFHVTAPSFPVERDVWPRKTGVFIRQMLVKAEEGSVITDASDIGPPARELLLGQLGFVPRWVKSTSDAKLRSTKMVNTRSETVTTSNNSRNAWLAGQRCIVPMMAFLEDDWRSGKAVPTRITRVDGKPMGVAGLWECWTGTAGEMTVSFTLLTLNANSHALMHRYQQPGQPAHRQSAGENALIS